MSGAEVTFLLLLVWFALDYRIRNLKGTKMTDDDDDTQVYRSELKAAVEAKLREEIKAAVAAEREACAWVCDKDKLLWGQRYAALIRARGDKP